MNLLVLSCLTLCLFKVQAKPTENSDKVLTPCEICQTLTGSFEEEIMRTSRGKYEGGDALWEARRLKSYADSEIRLVEIQEKLCSKVEKDDSKQCYQWAEEYEPIIDEWWFKKKYFAPNITHYLCMDALKVC